MCQRAVHYLLSVVNGPLSVAQRGCLRLGWQTMAFAFCNGQLTTDISRLSVITLSIVGFVPAAQSEAGGKLCPCDAMAQRKCQWSVVSCWILDCRGFSGACSEPDRTAWRSDASDAARL